MTVKNQFHLILTIYAVENGILDTFVIEFEICLSRTSRVAFGWRN